MPKSRNLTKMKFGRLTVINYSHTENSHARFWRVKCKCGINKTVRGCDLVTGKTRSCGCLRKENKQNITHGMSKNQIYRTWQNMKNRCINDNNSRWMDYGGRGIKVCNRWLNSFEAFYRDMGNKPIGMTLERIDTSRNYEPSNCKWASHAEQSRNKRDNNNITHQGITLCLTDWANKLRIRQDTLWHRIYTYNWPIERALHLPDMVLERNTRQGHAS